MVVSHCHFIKEKIFEMVPGLSSHALAHTSDYSMYLLCTIADFKKKSSSVLKSSPRFFAFVKWMFYIVHF